MQPFTTLAGRAVPFLRENVDTDIVVRIERLSNFERDELEPYAFEALRYLPDGTLDPDCLFNQNAYRGAPILLAGKNFGCGSSREGAVWALACIGIRCVIAPSFGGIFTNNCYQNGVLPIELPEHEIEALGAIARMDPTAPITVDLEKKQVRPPNGAPIPFEIDTLRQRALLAGLDELGLTLQREAEIGSFQDHDRQLRPWVYTGLGGGRT